MIIYTILWGTSVKDKGGEIMSTWRYPSGCERRMDKRNCGGRVSDVSQSLRATGCVWHWAKMDCLSYSS